MNNQSSGKADWQVALKHHEDLCSERYNSIEKRLDNIEKLLRVTIGLVLGGFFAMPALIVALLKFF